MTSEPVPLPTRMGSRPPITTATVMALGRTRSTAPSRIAATNVWSLETVVQSFPTYQVIEKPSALMDLLTQTDPRHEGSGAARDAARTIADAIEPPGA